ncbi:efflux RND transporter periplasmic adaptor subunit [Caulobacter sp. Root1455]|uniref:efflux RND transporter periplasmic adaptor subunit n=1 Tax=Caulobacter sp. Root1455 TaxID=1736465 RepID=UPI000AB3B0B7|nr:efflux RND transporter periplasmic adaptor subunit [Caulobacter sp. Root1455]
MNEASASPVDATRPAVTQPVLVKSILPAVVTPVRGSAARRWRIAAAGAALIGIVLVGLTVLLGSRPVQIGQVRLGAAVDVVYASGVVEHARQAHVAPVTTAPIRSVAVEEGQVVRRGQVLAQLEDGPQRGTAMQVEAQAAQARVIAARTQRLLQAGFAAPAADEDAQAQRKAAEAAAASAWSRLADYRITAPIAGRILRRDAEPGDLAQSGKVLFLVADPARLRVTADVDERDVARLAVGQTALIRADGFPGETFKGRIDQITPVGDAIGRVFRVRVGLPPASRLRPGMTVELNLVTARRDDARLVPSTAIRDGAVWVEADGKARRVPVVVGAASGDQAEIVSGLAPGARIILSPPKDLRDGARVKPAKP